MFGTGGPMQELDAGDVTSALLDASASSTCLAVTDDLSGATQHKTRKHKHKTIVCQMRAADLRIACLVGQVKTNLKAESLDAMCYSCPCRMNRKH